MVSALTVLLLGCWLAGRSGVSGGRPDRTQPGAAPAPTRLGSTTGPGGCKITTSGAELTPTSPGSEDSVDLESPTPKPKGQTNPVIIGVSATAIVLLILFVTFVCFRRTRARKGATLKPNSTSSFGILKAPAQQDHIYTSVDKRKEPQTVEPDPEGHTYAELDGRALQAKWGGPAPAPQTSTYAVINMSRGPQQ